MILFPPKKKRKKGDEMALDRFMEEAHAEEYEEMKPMLSIKIMKSEEEKKKKKK